MLSDLCQTAFLQRILHVALGARLKTHVSSEGYLDILIVGHEHNTQHMADSPRLRTSTGCRQLFVRVSRIICEAVDPPHRVRAGLRWKVTDYSIALMICIVVQLCRLASHKGIFSWTGTSSEGNICVTVVIRTSSHPISICGTRVLDIPSIVSVNVASTAWTHILCPI